MEAPPNVRVVQGQAGGVGRSLGLGIIIMPFDGIVKPDMGAAARVGELGYNSG